jgi:dolichyl-phosphate-mannose--protein O-mannosyl transferase
MRLYFVHGIGKEIIFLLIFTCDLFIDAVSGSAYGTIVSNNSAGNYPIPPCILILAGTTTHAYLYMPYISYMESGRKLFFHLYLHAIYLLMLSVAPTMEL